MTTLRSSVSQIARRGLLSSGFVRASAAVDLIAGVELVTGHERSSLARTVNEEGAAAARDHSDRFGLFAPLPLPDVDAALEEIAALRSRNTPIRRI